MKKKRSPLGTHLRHSLQPARHIPSASRICLRATPRKNFTHSAKRSCTSKRRDDSEGIQLDSTGRVPH